MLCAASIVSLHRGLIFADSHPAKVEGAHDQEHGHQDHANVQNINAAIIPGIGIGEEHGQDREQEHNDGRDAIHGGPFLRVPGAHRGHFAAMRTPGQAVVELIEQERVVAVAAAHATHARHRGSGRRHGTGRQIDDSLAAGPRTGDPLRRRLADQQAIARTADVLFAGRCIPDGGRLTAARTLDHMLVPFARDIDHALAHAASDHRHRLILEIRGHLVRPRCCTPILSVLCMR